MKLWIKKEPNPEDIEGMKKLLYNPDFNNDFETAKKNVHRRG